MQPDSLHGPSVSAQEAHKAILAGRVARIIIGPDPDDPTCLQYLDRCYENYHKPMIYTEAIRGWSAGVKEAVCDPHDAFYVEWITDPKPLSITITDEEPPQRESTEPVRAAS